MFSVVYKFQLSAAFRDILYQGRSTKEDLDLLMEIQAELIPSTQKEKKNDREQSNENGRNVYLLKPLFSSIQRHRN